MNKMSKRKNNDNAVYSNYLKWKGTREIENDIQLFQFVTTFLKNNNNNIEGMLFLALHAWDFYFRSCLPQVKCNKLMVI